MHALPCIRLLAVAAALSTPAGLALAQRQPSSEPEFVTIVGVVKEVNVLRKSVTYMKVAESSYGPQLVTDLMDVHPSATISLDGRRITLKDLRAGDRVVFECARKPERALRVAALSTEELERLQREKQRIRDFENKVEAEHLRLIKELAAKQIAKDIERAKERAKASKEAKAKDEQKDVNSKPKKPDPNN